MTRIIRLTPGRVAKAIDVFVRDWPGHCHQVCVRLLNTGFVPDGSTLKRGRYTGPLVYGPYRAQILQWSSSICSQGHSWIETSDGTVIDPTRYVFEGVKPYVFVGSRDSYAEDTTL